MQLTFENRQLPSIIKFLNEVNLSKRASRGRTKLIKRLFEKKEEFVSDLNEIKTECTNESDIEKYGNDLLKEKMVINMAEYPAQMRALYEAMENNEQDWQGQNAFAYDILLDNFEKIFEETEVEIVDPVEGE